MIRKYVVLISLLMLSTQILAMEKESSDQQDTVWEQAKEILLWPISPFEVMGEYGKELNQKSIKKYGIRCRYVRPILRFVHGKPTTYLASGLYYGAVAAGIVKGYKKCKKWWQKQENNKELDKKRAMHQDCAWCTSRQKETEDITEELL